MTIIQPKIIMAGFVLGIGLQATTAMDVNDSSLSKTGPTLLSKITEIWCGQEKFQENPRVTLSTYENFIRKVKYANFDYDELSFFRAYKHLGEFHHQIKSEKATLRRNLRDFSFYHVVTLGLASLATNGVSPSRFVIGAISGLAVGQFAASTIVGSATFETTRDLERKLPNLQNDINPALRLHQHYEYAAPIYNKTQYGLSQLVFSAMPSGFMSYATVSMISKGYAFTNPLVQRYLGVGVLGQCFLTLYWHLKYDDIQKRNIQIMGKYADSMDELFDIKVEERDARLKKFGK